MAKSCGIFGVVYMPFRARKCFFSFDDSISSLEKRASDYAGGTVSVRRRLVAEKVIPAWPKVGHACVAPIITLVDAELQAELNSPSSILLPEADWPEVTPTSMVHADDDEWYQICAAGHPRGMFVPFPEEIFFATIWEKRLWQGQWV